MGVFYNDIINMNVTKLESPVLNVVYFQWNLFIHSMYTSFIMLIDVILFNVQCRLPYLLPL